MVSWDYLWPTLRCRRGGRSEPAPVNRLVVPLFGVSKRHCLTQGKRRAWFCQMTGTLPPCWTRGGWRHARTKFFTRIYGSEYAVPGPKLPTTVKGGYLNCKNPVHTFRILCAASSVRGSNTLNSLLGN
ncbi:hypothetical protein TNCV_3675701 [Trichonephila clavipes]|nr:hypothetical protein TNCV_3675701 [Trichonephila clavipes]